MRAAALIRFILPYLLMIASVFFFAIFFSAVSFGGIGLFVLVELLTN